MGIPVAVLETTEAASLGVAMLGGKAAGIVYDIGEMANEVVRIKYVCDPSGKRNAVYESLFAAYRELYPAMRSINHQLAALSQPEAVK